MSPPCRHHVPIVVKQEHKVSYRCSLPSPLQKRSKDYEDLHLSSASVLAQITQRMLVQQLLLLSFLFLWLWQEVSQLFEKLLSKVKENSEAQNLQNNNAIFWNPWIFSAMAMAMSIYRTLCVLVFLKISLQEMLIAFGNDIRFQK